MDVVQTKLKKKGGKRKKGINEQQNIAYLFILVPFILLIVFHIFPILMALRYSFTDYNVIEKANWVGFGNFKKIIHDQFFFVALKNTILYTALYVPLGLFVPLGAAIVLNKKFKGVTLFRTFFYLPVLCSSVATATIWMWLLNPQYGLFNQILGIFGINGPAYLFDARWAMPAIVVMSVWMGFGGHMMIFLAGLQGINPALYEAASLEGASSIQRFIHITWPQLRKTTFLVTTQLIIGAFQVFDQAYLLTHGGPGNSTITLVYYIYNEGFGNLRMGYASAVSFILFGIIFMVSLVNIRINSDKD